MLKIAVLVLVLTGTTIAAAGPGSVAFSTDDAGFVLVPVSLEGQTVTWTFLLDTGASHTIVSSKVAEKLGTRPVARTSLRTSTGSETQLVVRLGRMTIGAASAEGVLPSVIPAAQLESALPGVDGIVGQDFLGNFNYTLDYRKKLLSWTIEPNAASGTRLRMVREGDRFLVQVPAAAGGGDLSFVPDSGAEAFVLFERGGQTALTVEPSEGLASVSGAAGHPVDAQLARVRELRIGAATLKNVRTVVMHRADDDRAEGDGLLPLRLFASVSFNCRDGYVVLRK